MTPEASPAEEPQRRRPVAGVRGTLALVRSGEFLEPLRPVDRELLDRAGGARVVILPTASMPDGKGVPERWGRMGVDHFRAWGAGHPAEAGGHFWGPSGGVFSWGGEEQHHRQRGRTIKAE